MSVRRSAVAISLAAGAKNFKSVVRRSGNPAERGRDASEHRARGFDAHLLAEHSAQRKLEAVECAWHAQPRLPPHARFQQRVTIEVCFYDAWVGIQIEHVAHATEQGRKHWHKRR
jgi:hypothetical protein